MNYKILLVDDDPENLKVNKRLLNSAGYSVVTAESGLSALEIVQKEKSDFALVLMDYHMPHMNGRDASALIKKVIPSQQILAFSMDDTRETMRESFLGGVCDFLDKNIDNETLLSTVEKYCNKYEQQCRSINSSLISFNEKSQFIRDVGMIGSSDQTYELCRQIKRIAPSDATVLIQGETGTGKELVAQSLHKMSNRSKAPFIAVNIAAESANLLDSSLFGHKKGAFTGATNDHPGKFKMAEGGTIFLDEIGDLSLELQVKLLRVLQEREITPLGSTRSIAVDVRIIAATHRDLKTMIKEGAFREDLYYRLNTVILTPIPLRERPDDIEPLVAHFTEIFCKQYNIRKRFNRQCLDLFRKQEWKGNVRALKSMVEQHLINAEMNEILPKNLDISFFENQKESIPKTMEEIDRHLDEVKRNLLSNVIKVSSTKADAARTLGVTPNRLHYFLQKFGLV